MLDEVGTEGLNYQEAPLEGIQSLTVHRTQAGDSGDYHENGGRAKM